MNNSCDVSRWRIGCPALCFVFFDSNFCSCQKRAPSGAFVAIESPKQSTIEIALEFPTESAGLTLQSSNIGCCQAPIMRGLLREPKADQDSLLWQNNPYILPRTRFCPGWGAGFGRGVDVSDNKQIKALGLRFARALQMTVKTVIMFTIDHKSAERPVQQSFQMLNNLLKEVGNFTFGFVDNQIILNNLLTTDLSLRQLETEFLKRGISAVTVEPGLTMARYKKLISVLAAPSKQIDEVGGTLGFLDQNEIEGARILPAAKNQKKDEHGDTIIETDSEAYILSKQMPDDQAPRDFLDSIDALLESACFDPSTRTDVLSDFATRGVDGTGYGVPVPVPNLVALAEGESVVPASSPGQRVSSRSGSSQGPPPSGEHAAQRPPSAGIAGGQITGSHDKFGMSPGAQGGYSGNGTLGPGISGGPGFPGGGPGVGPGPFRGGNWTTDSSSGSFMELVEASVQRSLLEERGNPQKSYISLARILRNMGVDKILSYFPAERRDQLSGLPAEQLAAEYIEDTALQIAGTKLTEASGQSEKILVEEEVLRVLARSLQATHMADRLAQKLSQFIQDYAVPPHLQDKIREELRWNSLSSGKRYARLMESKHFSSLDFRRLIELSKELVKARDIDRATALATHYFDFLDDKNAQFDVTELSRAPELIRSIPLGHGGFAATTAQRLGRTLLREDLSDFLHNQAASALTVLSQFIAAFEAFQDVLAIGSSLETSFKRDPKRHKQCCGAALNSFLPPAAIERLLELFLLQRGDMAWGKLAATLLRFGAPASIQTVFNHLVEERDARNRMALVRLIGQLGPASIEIAYTYLKDDRWYVVRNICGALAELKDPDLAEHIAPALQHPDARVQHAALRALVHSRTVRAAPVIAGSLSKLAPNVLGEALDELMFLRHPKTISGLQEFVVSGSGNLEASKKAIQILAGIDDDDSLHALAKLFCMEELDSRIRRSALDGLRRDQSSTTAQILQELAATPGPLGDELRGNVKKSSAASAGK